MEPEQSYSASRKAKKVDLEKAYPAVNAPTSVERLLGVTKKNDDVRIPDKNFDYVLQRIVASVGRAVERGDAKRETVTLMDKIRECPELLEFSVYGICSRTGYCVEIVNKTLNSKEFKKWNSSRLLTKSESS